ncbi:MAG: hypothetical protein Q4A74_09945, partial [Cardiobacteriaceae bacterium]|nr:hypothetical protein [Cardiobacteriaceae bacterium]
SFGFLGSPATKTVNTFLGYMKFGVSFRVSRDEIDNRAKTRLNKGWFTVIWDVKWSIDIFW